MHLEETGQENCKQARLRTKQQKQEKSLQLDSISCSITSNMNLANNLSMYEVLFVHLAENFKGNHFEFLSRTLSGETLCKLLQIFPPKVLVYIWTSIPWHLFYYLMTIHLTNKIIIEKYMLFYFNKEIKSEHCSVYWLLFNNDARKKKRQINKFYSHLLKKKKKRRMRILGARIFSKFFWRENCIILNGWNLQSFK